eukprot:Partr_v1_DN28734_c5_g1_i1_m61734
MNMHCKTHRLIDGSLDDSAGPITAFDSPAFKIRLLRDKPNELAKLVPKVSKEFQAFSEKERDAYYAFASSYYVRVAEKLSKTPEYLKTEFERLQRVLAKNDVISRDKLDSIVLRRNILSWLIQDADDSHVEL